MILKCFTQLGFGIEFQVQLKVYIIKMKALFIKEISFECSAVRSDVQHYKGGIQCLNQSEIKAGIICGTLMLAAFTY